MILFTWAIDAYRDEKPPMFVIVATLVPMTTQPLLHAASKR